MRKSDKKTVHFVGAGGIGVSALARYFLAKKWAVSGSDTNMTALTRELRKEGLKVKLGQKKGHIEAKTDLVVYSQAIQKDNPELLEAQRRRIPILSYPEAIGALTRNYTTIGIAGAHGKSTTTALVASILLKAKKDPTVIIGTKIRELGGKNFRVGKSKYLVLESDEYGRAFLHYSPAFAVITNIDREHLDTYKDFTGVKRAFITFISRIKKNGVLVINKDDKGLVSLKSRIAKIAKKNKLKICWYSTKSPVAGKARKYISIFGEHNISNATAAITLAKLLGVKEKVALKAVHGYKGAWRRMEYRGMSNVKYQISKIKNKKSKTKDKALGIRNLKLEIFDDYAHHPSEIKATLAAFKKGFPGKPLICVFQPHQAKRLKLLFKDFIDAFEDADVLVLIPSYRVRGRDKENPRFTAISLAKAIQKEHPEKAVFYLRNPKNIKQFLSKLLHSGFPLSRTSHLASLPTVALAKGGCTCILVMMGAGNIADYTKQLL